MPWPDLIQPVAPKDMQWATTRACWHCILSFFPVESQLRCRPPNSCSSLLVYLVPSQNAGTFHCKACFGIHWSLILNTWPSHWTVRPLTVADSRGSRTPIGLKRFPHCLPVTPLLTFLDPPLFPYYVFLLPPNSLFCNLSPEIPETIQVAIIRGRHSLLSLYSPKACNR